MKKKINNQSFKSRIIKDLYQLRLHDMYTAIVLRYRITALKLYLNRLDINCCIMQHHRSKKIAHRWSTAYHIIDGSIMLGDLRGLKNGEDEDGNIWYKVNWDPGGPDEKSANNSERIKDNAMKLGQAKMHYAEEGYESDRTHRCPNLRSIPVSKHVHGKAIDIDIDWSQLGGDWSSKTELIISRFGLIRPHKKEPWHFELGSKRKFKLPFNIPFLYVLRKIQ